MNTLPSSEIAAKFLVQAMSRNGLTVSTIPVDLFLSAKQLDWLKSSVAEERRYFSDGVDSVQDCSAKIGGRTIARYELIGNKMVFTPVCFLGNVRPINIA